VVTSDVTSVLLSWQPPSPANGIVTGYSIGYYQSRSTLATSATDEDDMTIIVIDRTSALRYNVTGLLPFTTYRLQVVFSLLLIYLFSASFKFHFFMICIICLNTVYMIWRWFSRYKRHH